MARTITFLLLTLLLSCQPKSQTEPAPKQYSVPAEVEPYVQAFLEQVRQRNISVPSDNLIITFGQTTGQDVCGQCDRSAGKTPRITLKADGDCWKTAFGQEREALVFHELGHCWLNRDHLKTQFPIGAYVSLMNPDDVSVYATCRYPIGGDVCDKRPRRGYYLDELFDPKTPTPAWGK
ncbi:MAG: hypothetical protein EAZ91_04975 [Cytophagales bacterium]|nr:MAG: hypothetical protein EAZ91_04975 [Cytophagales bacterium]